MARYDRQAGKIVENVGSTMLRLLPYGGLTMTDNDDDDLVTSDRANTDKLRST